MILMYSRRLLICLFALMMMQALQAQVNIKIAYDAAFTNPANLNSLLTTFNEERDWLDKRFDEFRFFQGIQLGARYELEWVDLEFSLYNLFQNSKAEGQDPAIGTTTQHRQLFYQFNGFSIGANRRFGFIHIGASIDLERFHMRWRESSSGDRNTLVRDNQLTSRFYISFETPKYNSLSICFRPYVKIPWGSYNLQELSNELENASSPSDVVDDFMHFGFQFIFFNGR
ncbi:MAG: hypothetical protein AAFP19_05200 [Bacteroidota bacterium]